MRWLPDELKKQSSVQRWLNAVIGSGIGSTRTEKLYLHFLGRFCEFLEMNPDSIISDRRGDLRSDDDMVQRRHEEKLILFQQQLEKEDLARSSIGTAQGVIKSFYSANYSNLRVNPPKTWAATQRSVPSPTQLKRMVDSCRSYRDRAIIIFLAQTGMGIGDLPLVTLGLIEKELSEGIVPLHIHMVRQKTKVEYDTFLGRDGVTYLKLYLTENPPENNDSPIFDITPRTIESIVKNSSIRTGLLPHVTPHRLRSFFKTYLTLNGAPREIVEYWMGHTVAYGGAYLVPPVDSPMLPVDSKREALPSQRNLYAKYESVISIEEEE